MIYYKHQGFEIGQSTDGRYILNPAGGGQEVYTSAHTINFVAIYPNPSSWAGDPPGLWAHIVSKQDDLKYLATCVRCGQKQCFGDGNEDTNNGETGAT